jgi:prepilin-type N-terminal cleavage/methylation domain-containing protein
MKYSATKKSGFTLIEMVVSLGIFAVVAVVAVGALIRVVGASKRAQTMQTAINNLSYVLDTISREGMVANNLFCYPDPNYDYLSAPLIGNPCKITTNGLLAFKSSKMDPTGSCRLIYAYKLDTVNHNLMKSTQQNCGDTLLQAKFSSTTERNIVVTDFKVGVGDAVTGFAMPTLFVRLKGVAGTTEKDKTYFDVETAVTQRVHD